MPFRSKAQMRKMFQDYPVIAEKWSQEFKQRYKDLPERVTYKTKKKEDKKK